jgi:diguanylate cyclase (GGDEF)-like protein
MSPAPVPPSRLAFRPGVFLASAALIATVMLAIVTIPQALSRHARLQVLRDHVGEVARLAASAVDGDIHRTLLAGNASAEARAAALAPLLRLHAAWPEAKYLYTMGSRDGQAFFVLDTAQDAAFAASRNLRASGYLEPFELREEYASNWLQELDAGRTFVNDEFQHDDYGYFLTGHAPIFDAAHGVAGFVGVDFDLDYYLAEEGRFRRIELASVLGTLLLSLLLGYVYARHHYRQKAELRAHYESSMNDALTGLLNRRGALAAIEAATARAGARTHAALLVDIDHFKSINDTHGHAASDAVISRLARALRVCLGPHDVPARLGGDEFLVYAPNCDLRGAQRIAEALLAAVRAEGASGAGETPFGISVGIGVARPGEGDFDVLYKRADFALYEAKAAGKDRYAVFDPAASNP